MTSNIFVYLSQRFSTNNKTCQFTKELQTQKEQRLETDGRDFYVPLAFISPSFGFFLSLLCLKIALLIGWPLRASWVWIDLTWILWAAITEMFKQTLRQIRIQKAEPGMLGTRVWGSIKHGHRKKRRSACMAYKSVLRPSVYEPWLPSLHWDRL